jgi:hypothetical protein
MIQESVIVLKKQRWRETQTTLGKRKTLFNFTTMKTPFEIMQEQMDFLYNVARTPAKKMESELSHEQKTLRFYAHDYRNMEMSEENLTDLLESFAEALNCDHVCSSDCRREGCNCNCGEYHF